MVPRHGSDGSTDKSAGDADSFPALVISLDFELRWGMTDQVVDQEHPYWRNIINARDAVQSILRLFEKKSIHATWATVGFLFAKDRTELDAYSPGLRPDYQSAALNPYAFATGLDEEHDPLHFAASLVQEVLDTPGQELASHTFSHYLCSAPGHGTEPFAHDLQAAQAIAGKYGVSLRSLAFPCNQVNQEYLPALMEHGFSAYRGNPRHPIYDASSRWSANPLIRILRLADCYINLTGHHTVSWPEIAHSCPVNVRASRFLRPYCAGFRALDKRRRRRIIAGLRHAAQRGHVFHLWWHPHNFGLHLEDSLAALEEIVAEFEALTQSCGMRSLNMLEAQIEAQRLSSRSIPPYLGCVFEGRKSGQA